DKRKRRERGLGGPGSANANIDERGLASRYRISREADEQPLGVVGRARHQLGVAAFGVGRAAVAQRGACGRGREHAFVLKALAVYEQRKIHRDSFSFTNNLSVTNGACRSSKQSGEKAAR